MSDTADLGRILPQIHLFRELDSGQIDRLTRGTRLVRAARDDIIVHRGTRATGFHYLIKGRVKLVIASTGGSEKVVELIEAGSTFGEAVMFLNRNYPVNGVAVSDSLLVYISRQTLIDTIERDSTLAVRMLAGLSLRLHSMIQDVESYCLNSSSQRVIGYLLREAGHHPTANRSDHYPVDIQLPATKAVVASRLSLTPETFSRILRDLTQNGLIEVRGRQLRLIDLQRLKSFGQGSEN